MDTASFTPITTTAETIKVLLKESKPADMIGLYMAYAEIAVWQNNTTIRATNEFMINRLHWGEAKLTHLKQRLINIGLIENVVRKGEDGKVKGHYVRVNYMINHTIKNPGSGFNQGMETEGTSALKESISTIKRKKSTRSAVFAGNASDCLPDKDDMPVVFGSTVDAMQNFIDDRKERKKPMTVRAVTLAFKRVYEWYPNSMDDQVACINQSIEHGWLGLFELKSGGSQPAGNGVAKL